MEKKQVQEAIGRIDNLLGKARFTEPILNREDHVVLVNDIRLIQQCCMKQFEEPEDERANIVPIRPEPGNEACEGGGDSV